MRLCPALGDPICCETVAKSAFVPSDTHPDKAKAGLQVSIDAVKELLVACKGIDPSLA